MRINSENFFDIAEALYTYCSLNIYGIGSSEYQILCCLDFKPGLLWSESRVEKENPYFDMISNDNFKKIYEELTLFLEGRNE